MVKAFGHENQVDAYGTGIGHRASVENWALPGKRPAFAQRQSVVALPTNAKAGSGSPFA